MSLRDVSSWHSFGGTLSVHDHESSICNCDMRFAVYVPPAAASGKVPVLWYLSGLTCDWSNVMEKSGLQRIASELGLMVVAPDTSPRGDDVANDEAYDLGQGAGFYLSATQKPWADHFQMDKYIVDELSQIIAAKFPADMTRQGITGHSMGGHGALTLHLKHPEIYKTVSAFSPIVAPTQVPWGQKAFSSYLGDDQTKWLAYDATALVRKSPSSAHILIDQGGADQFIDDQLKPELFEAACKAAGQKLALRRQAGYDHSYYFISSFIADHLKHHAVLLGIE